MQNLIDYYKAIESTSVRMVEAVNEAVSHQVMTCIIDISQLRYINSSGIGVLITILTKFRNKGGEVYLMNPSDSVKKLLAITKLSSIFQVISKEEEVMLILQIMDYLEEGFLIKKEAYEKQTKEQLQRQLKYKFSKYNIDKEFN